MNAAHKRTGSAEPTTLRLRAFILFAAAFTLGVGCETAGPSDQATVPAEERGMDFESNGFTLEGTLSLPERSEGARVPGIVLVHGSGPHGRDEVLPISYPLADPQELAVFAELSAHLTARGYAVFRYDKRTCASCEDSNYPVLSEVLYSDFSDDASAALDALALNEWVDAEALVLIGHSQGGAFPPRMMKERSDLVAGVMLAAAYRPIDEILEFQLEHTEDLLAEAGYTLSQVTASTASLRALVEDVESLRAGSYSGTMPAWEQQFWLDWMSDGDTLPDAATGLDRPLLAVSGEYDWNVPPVETEAWADLFAAEGTGVDHRTAIYPCVTHALNCVNESDWLQVQNDDIGLEIAPDLLAGLDDFLATAAPVTE